MKSCRLIIAAAIAGAFSSATLAATASYSFNTCLTGACGGLGNPVTTVGTLNLKDVTGGVEFTFTASLGSLPAGAFISDLGFSQSVPKGGTAGAPSLVSGSFSLPTITFNSGGASLGAAAPTSVNSYTWEVFFATDGSHGGIHRFDGTDSVKWTITGTGLDVSDFGRPAMAHVNAFDAFGNSAKIMASVPEPETYAMFLAGLGLMGAVARRRVGKRC